MRRRQVTERCRECEGQGKKNLTPCKGCAGKGFVRR